MRAIDHEWAQRYAGRRARACVATLGVCAVALALAGCGGATSGGAPPAGSAAPAAPAAPGAIAAGAGDALREPIAGTAQGPDTGAGGTAGTATTSEAVSAADQPLIVETGTLEFQVASLDVALPRARSAIEALGGYVSASDRSDLAEQQRATVTYRVPAAKWGDALDALRALASRVVSEQTQAVEVTGQVLDLGARIENLRVTEKALQAIMARATKISDVLEVQAQLTSVQGQIEQLVAQKTLLQQQAALGTLTVAYEVPVVAVAAAASGWDLGRQLDTATAQLVEIGQTLASIAIWLVVVGLPLLVLCGLLLGPLALVARRVRGRRAPSAPAEPA